MYATLLLFPLDVLFLAEPSQTGAKQSDEILYFGRNDLHLLFLERGGGVLGRVNLPYICLFGVSLSPIWPQLKPPILHTST